jgi:mRNA interferase RelE/StbE
VTKRYELRIHRPARRSLEQRLPLAIALAIWEFCNGPLREEPHRVGRPLGRELAGYYSARRGAYRVIYRVDEDPAVVHVVRVEHRADVYRRH